MDSTKHHDTIVLGAGRGRPRDPLVSCPFGDLGVPLAVNARDLNIPVQPRVTELPNVLHAFHEARKLLEPRPLLVGGPQWDVNLDGLLDRVHGYFFRLAHSFASPLRTSRVSAVGVCVGVDVVCVGTQLLRRAL